jgi:hypothetical protein
VDGDLGTRALEMVAEGAVAARLNALWEELSISSSRRATAGIRISIDRRMGSLFGLNAVVIVIFASL